MSQSTVSDRIRDLYEAYPYPSKIPGGGADPHLEYILAFREEAPGATRSFFDAGCGTGLNVMGGAAIYPHFQVYGCDLNRVALRQIQSDAVTIGMTNLQVKEMDLLNLDPDFGPSEGFDIIFSTGVIHHTPDPIGILKSLAGRLAPQGVMRLMVYGEKGRSELYRFAGVARKLYGQLPWKEQIAKARDLMAATEAATRARHDFSAPVLRGVWSDALITDDVEFADRYLNPHDQPFSVGSLKEALQEAGLEFHSWFEPRDWDLETLLPEFSKSGRAPQDPWERFALVENLFSRQMLDLYVVKPGFQKRRLELTPSTYIGLNPQLFLDCIKARGSSFHRAAQLRMGKEVLLDPHEGALLESIGLRFLPIQEMVKELPMPSLEHWIPIIENLIARDFLFCPHC